MGEYLAKPNREKEIDFGENDKLRFVAVGMQGWRRSMEDSHIAEKDLGGGVSFFGVFDGHGGQEVALYVKKHLVPELIKLQTFKAKQYDKALIEIFYKMDEMMLTPAGKKEIIKLNGGNDQSYAGCTATTCIITPTEIICANAGDSRTVLGKGKVALEMSQDHKPDDPEERKRIYNANGFVEDGRVNGALALSRAIGDFEYKGNTSMKPRDQAVTAFPDIKIVPIDQSCKFILLACDGVWDCMTSQEAITWCNDKIYGGGSKKPNMQELKDGVCGIVDNCCATDIAASQGLGCDNITACLVELL